VTVLEAATLAKARDLGNPANITVHFIPVAQAGGIARELGARMFRGVLHAHHLPHLYAYCNAKFVEFLETHPNMA
jgi:hypothetical protein